MEICRSQPRKNKFVYPFPDYSKEQDIVEYELVEICKSTGEKDTDFIVDTKLVEVSRVNRQKFLNEQAKGHSIYEIIDKVLLTGDVSLIPTVKHSDYANTDSGAYGDFSKLPLDRADAYSNKLAIEDAISKLDPALVGDDLYKFLQNVTVEDIENFYKEKYGSKEQENGGAL